LTASEGGADMRRRTGSYKN